MSTVTQEMYALGDDRSADAVRRVLDHCLPNRVSTYSDHYPVPENSEKPRLVLTSEAEVLSYLGRHPNEPYGLYWSDGTGSSRQAMVFYTRDGYVIFGLAEESSDPARLLTELREVVGATYGMLGSEHRPPDLASEFIAMCRA